MPVVAANGLDIAYEERGQGEPVLLIMGIGAQMLWWRDGLFKALADSGFRVIRFDNRDVGLSSWLDSAPVPDLRGLVLGRLWSRVLPVPPYTLGDMASDAAGLMDALGIERAHIVGASMGGMIAQHLAFERPHRVRSLVSLSSAAGDLRTSIPRPHAFLSLVSGRPKDRAEVLQWSLRINRLLRSRGMDIDEADILRITGACWDRGVNPAGFLRQMAAIVASGDRTDRLQTVEAPTTVIHGSVDPLVRPAAGQATALAIPGARYLEIEGMGHDMPPAVWPTIVEAVKETAGRANM